MITIDQLLEVKDLYFRAQSLRRTANSLEKWMVQNAPDNKYKIKEETTWEKALIEDFLNGVYLDASPIAERIAEIRKEADELIKEFEKYELIRKD